MEQVPEPGEEVPEFVVEVLDEQSPAALDATVDYLDGSGGLTDVPSAVVEAASMQDDATADAMADFAADLASFYRDSEYDSVLAAIEDARADEDDTDDGADDGTTALRYGNL